MAEMTRNPDYLRRHLDVKARVRNLETGVHPTRGDLNYYDNYAATDIECPSESQWTQLFSPSPGRWQRRVGIVSLTGQLTSEVIGSSLDATGVCGVLPPEARPIVEGQFQAQLTQAPWRTRIKVATNGEITVYKDDITSASTVLLVLDGISWLVN